MPHRIGTKCVADVSIGMMVKATMVAIVRNTIKNLAQHLFAMILRDTERKHGGKKLRFGGRQTFGMTEIIKHKKGVNHELGLVF